MKFFSKRLFSIALTFTIAIGLLNFLLTTDSFVAQASQDYFYDGYLCYTASDFGDGLILVKCDEEAVGDIVIPEQVNGHDVQQIDEFAFWGCNGITSVSVPDTVGTIIGNNIPSIDQAAFMNCTNLESVHLGKNVKNLGMMAFFGCTKLEEINLPDSLIDIGSYAFYLTALTEIHIPYDVSFFGDLVFALNNNLTKITVDEKNRILSSDDYGVLFNKNKTKLIQYPIGNTRETYYVPTGVETLADLSFSPGALAEGGNSNGTLLTDTELIFGGDNLKAVILPSTVTRIGSGCFRGCKCLEYVHISSTKMTLGSDYLGDSLPYGDMLKYSDAYLCGNEMGSKIADIYGYTYKNCNNHKADNDDTNNKEENDNGKNEVIIGANLPRDSYDLYYKESVTFIFEESDKSNYTFTSSNPSVAKVDGTKVTAVGRGSATITVTHNETGYSDSCEINVSYTWWQWLIKILFLGFLWY